jgi:hypothetical protein
MLVDNFGRKANCLRLSVAAALRRMVSQKPRQALVLTGTDHIPFAMSGIGAE